uniref:Uncharacterized protein n=1 Tax=Arundo donax TaxID=35708 RepID=A0A0A9A016_ARUDO
MIHVSMYCLDPNKYVHHDEFLKVSSNQQPCSTIIG